MGLGTLFSSALSIASLSNWIHFPFTSLALMIDGVIYSLVSYAYNLFLIMAQLNVNTLLEGADVLVSRVKALIMVFILFRLGIALVQYLLDPDKASNAQVGGVALIKRVVIVAILLVSYNFIFGFLNDLSLLIVGSSEGASFTVLNHLGVQPDQEGLLARLVFGSSGDSSTTIAEYGNTLATRTLKLFVQNGGSSEYDQVFDAIESGDKDFGSVADLSANIGKNVFYRYPFLSGIVGIYLIYCIVKISIEVGVRMFKLLILQVTAPIAIISYIDPSTGKKVSGSYVKAYVTTYTDVFIRILSMFLVTAFVSLIANKLPSMVSGVTSNGDGIMQKVLLMVIVLVAGYRFALLLPKFINEIFGFKLSEESKKSFGQFMGSLAGSVAGIGGATAATIAAGGTLGQGLVNAGRGAFSGYNEGGKGKNVSDWFKNTKAVNDQSNKRAGNWAVNGMLPEFGKRRKEVSQPRIENLQKQNTKIEEQIANAQKEMKGQDSSYKGVDGGTIKYGDNADSFANTVADNNAEVISALAEAEKAQQEYNNFDEAAYRRNAEANYTPFSAMKEITDLDELKAAKEKYAADKKTALDNDVASRKAQLKTNRIESNKAYQTKRREEREKAKADYDGVFGAKDLGGGKTVNQAKAEKKANEAKIKELKG